MFLLSIPVPKNMLLQLPIKKHLCKLLSKSFEVQAQYVGTGLLPSCLIKMCDWPDPVKVNLQITSKLNVYQTLKQNGIKNKRELEFIALLHKMFVKRCILYPAKIWFKIA